MTAVKVGRRPRDGIGLRTGVIAVVVVVVVFTALKASNILSKAVDEESPEPRRGASLPVVGSVSDRTDGSWEKKATQQPRLKTSLTAPSSSRHARRQNRQATGKPPFPVEPGHSHGGDALDDENHPDFNKYNVVTTLADGSYVLQEKNADESDETTRQEAGHGGRSGGHEDGVPSGDQPSHSSKPRRNHHKPFFFASNWQKERFRCDPCADEPYDVHSDGFPSLSDEKKQRHARGGSPLNVQEELLGKDGSKGRTERQRAQRCLRKMVQCMKDYGRDVRRAHTSGGSSPVRDGETDQGAHGTQDDPAFIRYAAKLNETVQQQQLMWHHLGGVNYYHLAKMTACRYNTRMQYSPTGALVHIAGRKVTPLRILSDAYGRTARALRQLHAVLRDSPEPLSRPVVAYLATGDFSCKVSLPYLSFFKIANDTAFLVPDDSYFRSMSTRRNWERDMALIREAAERNPRSQRIDSVYFRGSPTHPWREDFRQRSTTCCRRQTFANVTLMVFERGVRHRPVKGTFAGIDEPAKFKYTMAIRGRSASSRDKYLLMSNSTLFRAQPNPFDDVKDRRARQSGESDTNDGNQQETKKPRKLLKPDGSMEPWAFDMPMWEPWVHFVPLNINKVRCMMRVLEYAGDVMKWVTSARQAVAHRKKDSPSTEVDATGGMPLEALLREAPGLVDAIHGVSRYYFPGYTSPSNATQPQEQRTAALEMIGLAQQFNDGADRIASNALHLGSFLDNRRIKQYYMAVLEAYASVQTERVPDDALLFLRHFKSFVRKSGLWRLQLYPDGKHHYRELFLKAVSKWTKRLSACVDGNQTYCFNFTTAETSLVSNHAPRARRAWIKHDQFGNEMIVPVGRPKGAANVERENTEAPPPTMNEAGDIVGV